MEMFAFLHLYTYFVYAGRTGSCKRTEPSFPDTAMSTSTKIKYAGSFDLLFVLEVLIYLVLKIICKGLIEYQ